MRHFIVLLCLDVPVHGLRIWSIYMNIMNIKTREIPVCLTYIGSGHYSPSGKPF